MRKIIANRSERRAEDKNRNTKNRTFKRRVFRGTAAALCAAMLLAGAAGCGSAASGSTGTASVTSETSDQASTQAAQTAAVVSEETDASTASSDNSSAVSDSDQFTERDLSTDYEIDCTITLADGASSADGSGVSIDGDTVTITAEGTYLITGSLSEGQIIIDVEDTEKVQLVLDGVSITNESDAAVYVLNADKVFLTTAEGSTNTLTVTGEFPEEDEYGNSVDAAVFSKDDLCVNGSGTLTVVCETGHGIVSKNDLKVCGGTLNISCAKKGLTGDDSVRIADGMITIDSGTDGIHVENDDETVDAYFYMSGGTVSINAGDDGIDAAGSLTIDGGTIDITECQEGIEGLTIVINDGDISIVSADDGINASDGSGGEAMGMMSGGSSSACMTINGGSIYINSSGDGLDSNGNLYVNGGTVLIDGATVANEGGIDIGDGAEGVITGGTVIVASTSGMPENFGANSTQGSILYTFSDQSAGTVVTLTDSSGNVIAEYTPSKTFGAIVISTPEIQVGETYTLTVGSQSYTIEMTSIVYGSGGMMGGMGQMGQMGDMGSMGEMPQDGSTDSGMGQMPDMSGDAASGGGFPGQSSSGGMTQGGGMGQMPGGGF
ncbi:MAG: carbohydrate-binding domain-containing protein [Lachnospiraceae bacterium]|nr:carbohydrate-binding domain-containing protein [Lachnospiraceae bacterium]